MHLESPSPPELQDAIKCFWYERKALSDSGESFDVMPDGSAEIIFYFGNQCSISQQDLLQQLPSPFMMGLLDQPAVFTGSGKLEILGIRCFPWTVFDLLGLPSGQEGVRTFEHPVAALQQDLGKLIRLCRIEDAFDLLRNYFLEARTHIAKESLLYKAGIAMRKSNGNLPVNQVAEAAHATIRTLERNFKKSSGHTVKDVSSLMRFEQVRNELWINPTVNLAGLAHDLGYTDQSHLSREFKRYSGVAPSAFAKKAKEGRQVAMGDFVAFIQE